MCINMRIKVKTDREGLPCGFCGCVALSPSNYDFALTSTSLRDFPFLYEMIGGFVNIFSTRADCVTDSRFPSIFVSYF